MNNAAKTCLFSDFPYYYLPFIYDIISFFQEERRLSSWRPPRRIRSSVRPVQTPRLCMIPIFLMLILSMARIVAIAGNAAGFVLDVQIQNIRLVDQSGCGYINGIAGNPWNLQTSGTDYPLPGYQQNSGSGSASGYIRQVRKKYSCCSP